MCRCIGGGSVFRAVPGEAVAVVSHGVAGGGGTYLEVEDAQRVTAVGGGVEHVGMEACIGTPVDGALEGVGLVVADGVGDGVVVDGTDVEAHDDGGVGAGDRRYHHSAHDGGVGDGGVEQSIIPSDRQLVEADVAVEATASVPLDVQGVADGGVTAYVVGDGDEGETGTVGECLSIESIGQLILDDGLLERAGRGEADSEVEHDDAVVAIDIGDGVAIDAASSDGLTLPDERQIIVADGRVDFGNRVYPYLDGVLLCAGGERGEMDVVDTEVVARPP